MLSTFISDTHFLVFVLFGIFLRELCLLEIEFSVRTRMHVRIRMFVFAFTASVCRNKMFISNEPYRTHQINIATITIHIGKRIISLGGGGQAYKERENL